MGILFQREKRLAPTFAEPPIAPYPGASVFGQSARTSEGSASLAVPTVWACVGLLSNAVSMLRLETFTRNAAGVPTRAADPQVVLAPAADMTQSEWLHMLMVSVLMRGNIYGEIVRRDPRTGYALQVELLNPDNVRVDVDRETGAWSYLILSSQRKIAREDMWHVRGLTLPGSKQGLSPLRYAAATIGIDLESRSFASDFFANGAHPSSILTTDQPVTQDQAQTIKDRFRAASSAREPVTLGAGLKYEAIQVTPEESQFLATQQANVAQIARYFGVPPEMVGGSGGNSMTYANVEQRSLDFLTYAVAPWLRRIEDAFFTLLPGEQYVLFNTSALLRVDAQTQATVDNMHLAGKVRTPSEIRAREGLAPFTPAQAAEADMVPLTITPNGGAKALPPMKEPPGPTAPVPTADLQGVTSG